MLYVWVLAQWSVVTTECIQSHSFPITVELPACTDLRMVQGHHVQGF